MMVGGSQCERVIVKPKLRSQRPRGETEGKRRDFGSMGHCKQLYERSPADSLEMNAGETTQTCRARARRLGICGAELRWSRSMMKLHACKHNFSASEALRAQNGSCLYRSLHAITDTHDADNVYRAVIDK